MRGSMVSSKVWFLGFVLAGSAGAVDFASDVQPIFEKSCYSCHGAKQQMVGLRLDSKTAVLGVIQPGKPDDSTLYRRVAGIGDQARMPMGGQPLAPSQIAVIRKWIETAEVKKHWA